MRRCAVVLFWWKVQCRSQLLALWSRDTHSTCGENILMNNLRFFGKDMASLHWAVTSISTAALFCRNGGCRQRSSIIDYLWSHSGTSCKVKVTGKPMILYLRWSSSDWLPYFFRLSSDTIQDNNRSLSHPPTHSLPPSLPPALLSSLYHPPSTTHLPSLFPALPLFLSYSLSLVFSLSHCSRLFLPSFCSPSVLFSPSLDPYVDFVLTAEPHLPACTVSNRFYAQ
mgnify:CR=1 FL=1